MKIALLQINPTVGDLAGNARLILDALGRAGAAGADLAVSPELSLVGYLPRDLLLSPEFVARSRANPQSELSDHAEWSRRWAEALERGKGMRGHRWN